MILKILIYIFQTRRFSYADPLFLIVGVQIGGWQGYVLAVFLMGLGWFIGGLAKAWRDHNRGMKL
jgi:hypothetical protein